MLNNPFLTNETEKVKEGDLYKILNISCWTFKLYFGYYEECERENPVIHTAEDGTEHNFEYVEETYSTCTEHGYTAGLYRPDCDEYVSGHEEKELMSHYDEDGDGICDECNDETIEQCDHACHKSGIRGFFWKIALFFNKLFKTNQYCECGEAHY